MPSLTLEERQLVASTLGAGERVEAWVQAGTRVSAQTWVLTTSCRILLLDRLPNLALAGELPLERVTGVECAVRGKGAVLYCWSLHRRLDLVGADVVGARRFEAALRRRLGAGSRLDD